MPIATANTIPVKINPLHLERLGITDRLVMILNGSSAMQFKVANKTISDTAMELCVMVATQPLNRWIARTQPQTHRTTVRQTI